MVKDLEKALSYKRLISYGGLLKEMHKKLNLDDVEDGDLIKVNGKKKMKAIQLQQCGIGIGKIII